MSVVYLDDFLLGKNKEDCLKKIQITRNTLEKLGFLLNFEKCKIKPPRKVKFLDFLWRSDSMSIELTQKKSIFEKALELKEISTCKI